MVPIILDILNERNALIQFENFSFPSTATSNLFDCRIFRIHNISPIHTYHGH